MQSVMLRKRFGNQRCLLMLRLQMDLMHFNNVLIWVTDLKLFSKFNSEIHCNYCISDYL